MGTPQSHYGMGRHPNSLANLADVGQRAKPGERSRNPSGLAAKKIRKPDLDVLLARVLGEEQDGMCAAEALLKVLRRRALEGDVKAAGMLLDRAYGLPKATIGLINETPTVNFHDAE